MRQRSFLHGAFVLIAASLVTRLLGFVYRIYVSRLLGAEGIGLYQMIWPLLSLVLTFVTAGLPVAMSKLVAEALVTRDRVRVRRILRISTGVIITLSVFFTLLMWLLRGVVLKHWLPDPRSYPTYLAMIPIVAIIAVSSIFRGYFQGLQDMSPPAWQTIVETIARIVSVYLLAGYFIRYGIAAAAAWAMVGTVIGELVGLLYVAIQYWRRGRLDLVLPDAPNRSLETTKQTLRALGEIAIPVTLSSLIGSLLYAAEPVLVTRSLLRSGLSLSAATAQYGEYGAMAVALFMFPTFFTGSLAINLVPSVSEAIADRAHHRVRVRLVQSWRATALIGFPASVILAAFATPLCRVIYNDANAGPILAAMAPLGFLLYLQGPLAGILRGLNRAGVAMVISVCSGLIKLGLVWIWGSDPQFGIIGIAWATDVNIGLASLLSLVVVYRMVGFAVRPSDTLKMAVAALIMLIFMELIVPHHQQVSGSALFAAIIGGSLLYFVLCCAFRTVTSSTMQKIPRIGPYLAKFVAALPFAV